MTEGLVQDQTDATRNLRTWLSRKGHTCCSNTRQSEAGHPDSQSAGVTLPRGSSHRRHAVDCSCVPPRLHLPSRARAAVCQRRQSEQNCAVGAGCELGPSRAVVATVLTSKKKQAGLALAIALAYPPVSTTSLQQGISMKSNWAFCTPVLLRVGNADLRWEWSYCKCPAGHGPRAAKLDGSRDISHDVRR